MRVSCQESRGSVENRPSRLHSAAEEQWLCGSKLTHPCPHTAIRTALTYAYCRSTNIQCITNFRLFSAWSCLAENVFRPKFCFARFSVTVFTGGSSTGQKFDVAEMGFSPGRLKLVDLQYSAESIHNTYWCTVNFAYNDTRRGIKNVSLFAKCRCTRSLIICITVGWDYALGIEIL